jgi:ferredoxin
MSYYAEIDAAACAAHGDCVDVAPEAFLLEETAVVIGDAPEDVLLAAAEACPSAAITIIDRRTREQVYP